MIKTNKNNNLHDNEFENTLTSKEPTSLLLKAHAAVEIF